MKNKKKIMLITIISMLIVALIILFCLFFKNGSINDNGELNEELNNNVVNKVINSKKDFLSMDFTSSYIEYYNYEDIYNEYFTMSDSNEIEETLEFIKEYENIKIEDGYLFWKYDGEWHTDTFINDKIKYFNGEIILTETNKLYKINYDKLENIYFDFENVSNSCYGDDATREASFLCLLNYNLTKDMFQYIEYNGIQNSKKIDKVDEKIIYSSECVSSSIIDYYLIDNLIYILNYDNEFIDLDSYFKNDYAHSFALSLVGECGNALDEVLVKYDGYTKFAVDENSNKIKLKTFIILTLSDIEYVLLIDDNNKLYLVNKGQFYMNNTFKVVSIGKLSNYEITDSKKTEDYVAEKISLNFDSGETVTFGK